MRVSVYIAMSLDGYIARANGGLDWLPGAECDEGKQTSDGDYGYSSFMETVDVMIMGRNTFEKVVSFGHWPYGDKEVYVLSNTIKSGEQTLPDGFRLFSGPAEEICRELKESGARHAYVDGGKTIQGFLEAGLIDELIITIIPVLIGNGIPLFGSLKQDIKLRLLESKAFGNGFLQCKYEIY